MTDRLDYGILAILSTQLIIASNIKVISIILGMIAIFCLIGFMILRE